MLAVGFLREVNDVAALRAVADVPAAPSGRAAVARDTGATRERREVPRPPQLAARPQRTLKTLLFADFAGYSKLHDACAPLFQGRFWAIAAQQLAAAPVAPRLANTWGDALYLVFDAPQDGVEYALGLLARMRAVDWTAAGLPPTSQMRVALHAGPVFCGLDPIIGRDNYFGSTVTHAARIEPVTPPGSVYASEAFAATLAATGAHDYALEYVGQLALAKGYGESRIYRLDRR
jgi:adenylate cyclase